MSAFSGEQRVKNTRPRRIHALIQKKIGRQFEAVDHAHKDWDGAEDDKAAPYDGRRDFAEE